MAGSVISEQKPFPFLDSPTEVKQSWKRHLLSLAKPLSFCLFSGKEVVDSNCHDRAPLIHSGKPRVRYTIEEGFEEMEEGVPVTCFPCDRCVLL